VRGRTRPEPVGLPMDVDAIADVVRQSRKYRHLCLDTVARIARWALPRSNSQKDAVKRTKRKLHQVYGAYLAGLDTARLDGLLARMPEGEGLDPVRDACRAMMELHASTRERLDVLDTFYEPIFAVTGMPERILDLGCGLHPLALPWMGLPQGIEYEAWEIDGRIVDWLNRFFPAVGVSGVARWRDMSCLGPNDGADVVFLLKMIPCLEQQEKGWGARLLRQLRARHAVVSFPGRSLGGREKGMADTYAQMMDEMLSASGWRADLVMRAPELCYVLQPS